jgi:hypothetical protein
MKKSIRLMLVVIFVGCLAGVSHAANPTVYRSLNTDYGPISASGSYIVINRTINGYLPYFRIFIPPGTQRVSVNILDWGARDAVARHEIPPVKNNYDFSENSITTVVKSLAQLEASDQIIAKAEGRIEILYDLLSAPYLSQARGGWLYVKVGSGAQADYSNKIFVQVDAETYNNWYRHAGSNPDGSINWERDVEGVTEYLPPSAKPEKPIVTPDSNITWTSGISQTITATSTKATSIYGTVTTSSSGSAPENPRIPSATDNDFSASDSSLTRTLTGVAGEIRMYKYRFIAANSSGLSEESGVYVYTIDLRPITPGSVNVTPDTTFKVTPSNITVASTNATAIYYTQTNGSDPSLPTINDSFVPGPSNVVPLTGTPGEITTIKMRFMGYNENGQLSSQSTGVYTYVMDLTPPGAVSAEPSSGSWSSAPPPVNLSCANAIKIYYTVSSSTTGTPADPPEPTVDSSAITLANGSGTYSIPYGSNADMQTKVRFKGWNGGGFSPSSLLCTYRINNYTAPPPPPSGNPPAAASANPSSGNWNDASKAFTLVSAEGATSIIATYTKTIDGSTPATPPEPTYTNAMLSSSGSSVNFPIPTTPSKLTKVLMKFAGGNQFGTGTASATCSYTIDLTGQATTLTPGAVTVNPTSGSWTSAGQGISVSSANASQIEYAYNITTDGTDPAVPGDPSVPSTSGNPFLPSSTGNDTRGIISGASGTFTIPSTAGTITKIKIKFCGRNSSGYGTNTQTYSYTIDLKTPVLPAAVVVSPADTNWTTAPQTISVSSANAKQIKYNYTKTEDGSEPPSPADPSTASVVAGQTSGSITGASGNFSVPSSTNKNTRIKIRFCGKNDAGYGIATNTYTYGINLIKTYKYGDTISQPEAKAVPGSDITAIILTNVGGESVLDPNAKFLKNDATLSYSVADLVLEYLKALLNDASIQVKTSADGVMTIGSPKFGGTDFVFITGSLMTTADSHYLKSTESGNIQICTRNIIITLYPAGADQAMFKQTLESYGLNVSYGPDHLVLIEAGTDYLMSFRFQMYADRSRQSDTGASQCSFAFNAIGYGTVVVTYPDGTVQNLVPYIHNPEAFSDYLMKTYNLTSSIDSNTGIIYIKDNQGGILWKGLPENFLYRPEQYILNSEVQPTTIDNSLALLFITSIGTQVVFETK